MIELVRDVTFTTRTATESYTLNRTSVNLESIMQSTARELAADLESHHHFILTEQGNISSVMLDETLLRTIVTQVLSNAFKYSRDNTEVKASIELHDGPAYSRSQIRNRYSCCRAKAFFSSFFVLRMSAISTVLDWINHCTAVCAVTWRNHHGRKRTPQGNNRHNLSGHRTSPR